MSTQIPSRDSIDPRYKWRLDHIYVSVDAWEKDYQRLSTSMDEFAALEGNVADDPKAVIVRYFALIEECELVSTYAMLRRECDNADPEAQAMNDRVMQFMSRLDTATSFLVPELLAMPEETLDQLISDPGMKDYDSWLKSVKRSKAHTLSKAEEKIISMYSDLERMPDSIYSFFTAVDLKFPNIVLENGETKPLTEGTLGKYLRSNDREERRQAYENIMNTYGNFGTTVSTIYGSSVRKDDLNARLRKYSSARAAAMDPLEIPESVYDNLIQVVHESVPILDKYLNIRKKLMKVDDLHLYDLYVSLVQDAEMELSFEEAFALVKECLAPMGADYTAKLQEGFENGWMDVFPTQNKSSGAFSAGHLGSVHPYVLLNFNGQLDDALTLAHELGHAMHSYFSLKNQPTAKAHYSLFVAEVASICNEAIVLRSLLKKVTDNKTKAYLLNHFMESFRTTCFRQTMFAEFEKISHEMCAKGEPITKDALSARYYELNRQYYGNVCHVDACVANEWMRIPHFYRAFYVYVYATGLCAAVALSERIMNGGEEALADYRKFLSAGCSVPPIEALKLAGIDMSSPEPVRTAMNVFAELADQFSDCMMKE